MSTPVYTPIANLKGPTGATGPQGLPGTNAVENDTAFATYIASLGSLTRDALDAVIALLGIVSVMQYGATGDGETDDTDAIQDALDSGARCVFFPAGIYVVTTITVNTSGQQLLGQGMKATSIVRVVADATGDRYTTTAYDMEASEGRAVIEINTSSVHLNHLAVKAMRVDGSFPVQQAGVIIDAGIRARGEYDEINDEFRASVDLDVQDCYISGWARGCIFIGQGLTWVGNLNTLNQVTVDIDFPANWKDVGDANQYGWYTGFRTFRFENNRIQANSEAFVRNRGAYATFIKTIDIDGVIGDIGGKIFDGALCYGSIRHFSNDQGAKQRTPIINLMEGSTNWVIESGRMYGRLESDSPAISGNAPDVGIRCEGEVWNGTIRGVDLINLQQDGIRFNGPAHGIHIEDIYSENVGWSGNYSTIRFFDADAQVTIDDVRINQITESVYTHIGVSADSSLTDIKATNVRHVGEYRGQGFISPVDGAIVNDQINAAPTRGYFKAGKILWDQSPTSGSPMGWACTVSGNPGTWTPLANVP